MARIPKRQHSNHVDPFSYTNSIHRKTLSRTIPKIGHSRQARRISRGNTPQSFRPRSSFNSRRLGKRFLCSVGFPVFPKQCLSLSKSVDLSHGTVLIGRTNLLPESLHAARSRHQDRHLSRRRHDFLRSGQQRDHPQREGKDFRRPCHV